MPSLAVLVATRGRPAILRDLLDHMAAQSRPPDHVILVGSAPADLDGIEPRPGLTLATGLAGSSTQRNKALQIAADRFDVLVFFDDDFVPSRFWLERAERLFADRPDLAALTGTVLADGNKGPGIAPEDGRRTVARRDAEPGPDGELAEGVGPYGCNMAFRASAIAGLTFDHRLPLYAWLEDKDFGARVMRRGKAARAEALWGVHLGHKTGRVPGVRFGYSQIANPVYLCGKGTVPWRFAARIMTGNVIANLVRSVAHDPVVDRRGRLRGNLLAIRDLCRGRLAPERAARL